ncbi:heavy metal sensor histidine kinase [Herbaspirillum chlorophenolicum]|uniref:Sensor protein n=1 Tax=Herbaspirillum chlorophenolicum TaxID=211589 RepID=A0ABW8ETK7_9BURK
MKARDPLSMTLRLVALFALVALLTFAGVGNYLYRSLYGELERRDDEELLGKSRSIAHLVQEATSLDGVRNNRHVLLDTIKGHDQMLLLIVDAAGATVLEGGQDKSVRLEGLARQAGAAQADVIRGAEVPGGFVRFVAGQSAARSGEQALVIMALTTSDRMQLLGTYQKQVWYAAGIGTFLATLLSFFLVRRGLRPLRLMATQARKISASRLDTRLDIHAAPRELHEIMESFNAMLDRLHHSFERLTQFSSDLAHDLRTPLNNLLVQTQVALSKPRSLEEYQALLSSSVEEYERLSRMMESMLFLARAENAHVALQVRRLDVAGELGRIAGYFEGIAEDANVIIEVSGEGYIFADTMLLRRAMGNLVANAIRHAPAGSAVRIAAVDLAGATVVRVSNTGEGILPELLERIFDRFYRADPSRSSAGGTSGLGLAIVRSIMHLHGGEVGVTSVPGGLTVFSLTFPKVPESAT